MTTRTHTSGSANWLLIPPVALVALSLFAGTANAALVQVDFDSLSAGAVTATTLDGVTTGGSWTLNSLTGGSVSLVHAIENDGGGSGEKALSSKFHGSSNPTNLAISMTSTLDFTNAIDVDVTGAQFEFEVAQSKGTGFARPVKYSFLNSSGTEIFYFRVNDGNLYVNSSANQGSVGGGGNTGLATWDSTSLLVWSASVEIDTAGNVMWGFGGQNGATTIASTADIKTFQSNIDPDQWVGQGTYLNYFGATAVPEPSGLMLLLSGVIGLGLLRRRR